MMRAASARRRWVLVLALGYLVLHLPYLAPSLEDVDSINFALGLHDFDVSRGQPHPPGYPIFIAAGRVTLGVITTLLPALPAPRADALALALLSALFGAVALVGAARLFTAIEDRFASGTVSPLWPTALLAVSPLFWISGARPMSDMVGLAAVLWAQALLLERSEHEYGPLLGAFLAGLGGGIRVQTLALTAPACLLASVVHRPLQGKRLTAIGLAGLAGILAWAVPLTVASGGVTAYVAALGAQAGEDFAFVSMLWSDLTPRHAARAVYETLVLPWSTPWLAGAVVLAAAGGAAVAAWRTPRALGVIASLFVPYALYHLLLQETVTVRYALPVLPMVAWCATRWVVGARRVSFAAAMALVVPSFLWAVAGARAYAREPHPTYRALEDALRDQGNPPARVYSHIALRRALDHGGRALPYTRAQRQYEWLGPVEYWRGGGRGRVWFFADPKRTDLALIDPTSRRQVSRYVWSVANRGELAGVRPTGADWYVIEPPRWFVGEGWSLTPEAGGVTHAVRNGLDRRPIEAWVARGRGPLQVMVGGLHIDAANTGDVEIQALLDGVPVDRWTVSRAAGAFLHFLHLPDLGAATSPYATLRLQSRVAGGGPVPEVAIRQFDVQPATGVLLGFGEGWHEAEYAPETGQLWRWTSERSALELRGTPQPLVLTLSAESPLRYFREPPRLRVTSLGRTLFEGRPQVDFSIAVPLPEDIWQDRAATVYIESDQVYLPGQAEGTADVRRLAYRVFDARIDTLVR